MIQHGLILKGRRKGRRMRGRMSLPSSVQIRKLLATSNSCGSDFWDSPTLPRPLILTRAAIRAHDRKNSFIPREAADTDFQGDLELSHSLPKRFARAGGPDLSDLRGHPEPLHEISSNDSSHQTAAQDLDHDDPTEMVPPLLLRKRRVSDAASASSSTKKSRSSVTASSQRTDESEPYDRNFEAHLTASYVMPITFEKKPNNLSDWKEKLKRPCAEMSEEAFTGENQKNFCKAMFRDSLDIKVMKTVFPTIRGDVRYHMDTDRLCTNLQRLTKVNTMILRPDYMEGCKRQPEDSRLAAILGPFIEISEDQQAPLIPNLFAQVRSCQHVVLYLQARYAGACGARAMHKVLNVGNKTEIFDGNAYAASFTYYDATLRMYLHWIVNSKNAVFPLQYEMIRAGSWALDDLESCRKGISAFRNAQDYASELREQARGRALSVTLQMCPGEYQALVREVELSKLAEDGTPGKGDQARQGSSQGNDIQFPHESG